MGNALYGIQVGVATYIMKDWHLYFEIFKKAWTNEREKYKIWI